MPASSFVLRVCRSASLTLMAVASLLAVPTADAQQTAEASNMELVGASDLQGRSAYQPVIQNQNGRWIAYIGHHGGTSTVPKPVNPLTGRAEFNGTSIVDVTDPAHPVYLQHIPGEEGLYEGGGAQMARVCPGSGMSKAKPDHFYLLRTFGNAAHEIWDVTEAAKPVRVAVISGISGTHKNFWECDTGIAYLVSGAPGWRTHRMAQIFDLSDPAHPVFIRNFGLPGQQPGATGSVPEAMHGPISTGPRGNRVYFGYGTNRNGVMQIVDREKLLNGPKEPTAQNLLYPQVGRLDLSPVTGAHTTFPMLGMEVAEFAKDANSKRDFVLIVNESIVDNCREARQMAWIADVTVEAKPQIVSNFTVPEASGNFCSRGGRFGTHSSNESFASVHYKRTVFLAHFNAGVRAVDVRNPFAPKEVGYYIPAANSHTAGACGKDSGSGKDGGKPCSPVIQTNNVEVDERGLVYIVDRAGTGMHILRLSGAAARVADANPPPAQDRNRGLNAGRVADPVPAQSMARPAISALTDKAK
ncbi:MAG: hypothetical protein JWR22_1472 [Herminiimonas sp.]|nr:hypothetical protein [Herminiimonas sp.]